MKKYIVLIIIVALAAFLRFWQLGDNPPALTWDEVAWGYNAFSLGHDGKDEFGRFLPMNYLESFGDFKPPLYAYLAILPIKIFGLNELAVRFPSAFFGTLTVLATYFLVRQLFPEQLKIKYFKLAELCAFLLAISPWHIMLSRAAFEANVASFLIISGVALFLYSINSKPKFLVLSSICFALSLMTFNTARIVSPLLLLCLTIGFYKQLFNMKKVAFISIIIGLLIAAPTILFMFKPQASLRYHEVNIFTDAQVVKTAVQEIENDNQAWWSKIIHNRRWGYARLFTKHYLDNLNPSFLFIKGDGNPKFSTQNTGQLYLWEAPFLILGIVLIIRQKRGHWWLIPLWLVIAIIPAATARETPHALRTETTLPVWQVFIGYGIISFLGWFVQKKKTISYFCALFVLCLASIGQLIYFQHSYLRHYRFEYAEEWQYGYKEAIEYISQVDNKYNEIRFTTNLGRPYIYFLFYLHLLPDTFRQNAAITRDSFGFVNVESVGKYHFTNSVEDIQTKTLLVTDRQHLPQGANVVKNFNLPNNEIQLRAYEL